MSEANKTAEENVKAAQKMMESKEIVFYNDSPTTSGVAFEYDDVVDLMIDFASQSNTNILQELEGLRERVNLHNDMLHGYIQRHLLLEEIDKIISNHKTK